MSMSDLNFCLLDLAYRNICFKVFLDISMSDWLSALNEKDNKTEAQSVFCEKNKTHLVDYLNDIRIGGHSGQETDKVKKEKLSAWARSNRINISKDPKEEEMNVLINKHLFPQIFYMLNTLKNEKHVILQLLFPQLIHFLLNSFDLLNKTKNVVFLEKQQEADKYTKLLVESESREKLNAEYASKIKSLEETVEKLRQENNNVRSAKTEECGKLAENLEKMRKKYVEIIGVLNVKNAECARVKENFEGLKRKYGEFVGQNSSKKFLTQEKYESDMLQFNEKIEFLKDELRKEIERRKKIEGELQAQSWEILGIRREVEEGKKVRMRMLEEEEEGKKDVGVCGGRGENEEGKEGENEGEKKPSIGK